MLFLKITLVTAEQILKKKVSNSQSCAENLVAAGLSQACWHLSHKPVKNTKRCDVSFSPKACPRLLWARAPGTAAWVLSPAETADPGTWWTLPTARCVCRTQAWCREVTAMEEGRDIFWLSIFLLLFRFVFILSQQLKPIVTQKSLYKFHYTVDSCTCGFSPGVYVSCLDGVEEKFSHSDPLHVDEVRLEQSLGGLEPLSSHLDHTAIWQLEMCGRDEMKREGDKAYDTTEETGFRVLQCSRVGNLLEKHQIDAKHKLYLNNLSF